MSYSIISSSFSYVSIPSSCYFFFPSSIISISTITYINPYFIYFRFPSSFSFDLLSSKPIDEPNCPFICSYSIKVDIRFIMDDSFTHFFLFESSLFDFILLKHTRISDTEKLNEKNAKLIFVNDFTDKPLHWNISSDKIFSSLYDIYIVLRNKYAKKNLIKKNQN